MMEENRPREPSWKESSWETIAEDLLEQEGVALLPLSDAQQQIIGECFSTGRCALEWVRHNHTTERSRTHSNVVCIHSTDDSAHATGYHPAASYNSMSRYNAHREGFVFSDGNMCSLGSHNNDIPEFETTMKEMEFCLHGIANRVLSAMETELQLPENWFCNHLHHQGNHSQWHLKRYVLSTGKSNDMDIKAKERQMEGTSLKQSTTAAATTTKFKQEEDAEVVLLPSHTDPSLLSVVILDQPGKQSGAMGLQCCRTATTREAGETKQRRVWTELPCHGHAVAIVFVGSVLSYITGTKYPSAKHRVVQQRPNNTDTQNTDRMAATFFLRPSGMSLLSVPPSPALEGFSLKKQITFDTWSSRVSRNYMKNKNKQNTGAQQQSNKGNTNNHNKEATLHSPHRQQKDFRAVFVPYNDSIHVLQTNTQVQGQTIHRKDWHNVGSANNDGSIRDPTPLGTSSQDSTSTHSNSNESRNANASNNTFRRLNNSGRNELNDSLDDAKIEANAATTSKVVVLQYIFYSFIWIACLLLQLALFGQSKDKIPIQSSPPQGLHPAPSRVLQNNNNKKARTPGDAIFNNIDVYLRRNHGHSGGVFSNVHCIGRDVETPTIQANFSWMFRSCHFHKLCFDTEESEFFLLKPPPSLARWDNPQKELAIGAINPRWGGRGFNMGFDKVKWFPREVDAAAIQQYYELPSNVVMIPFHSMAAHNVGHLLWDDFYAIFTLLTIFGFVPDDYVSASENPFEYLLLRWSTKEKLYATCEMQKKKSKLCQENLERFLPLLGIDPRTYSTVKKAELKTNPNSLVQRPPQTQYVCSKQAVAGLGMLMDHGMRDHGWMLRDPRSGLNLVPHNIGRGGIFRQFRDFMVHNMGFPLELPTRPSKVTFSTFSSKGFERSLAFENQAAALQRIVPGNIQVQSIMMKDLSLNDQMQVALESAIFITVSGGGAVTGTFLPPGSTLIVYYLEDGGFDFWKYNPNTGEGKVDTPARLDWDLLMNAGHIRVHWLPIKTMETEDDIKILENLVLHELNIIGLL